MTGEQITVAVLTALCLIGFAGISVAVLLMPERPANREIIMLVVGALCTNTGMVLGYWFKR